MENTIENKARLFGVYHGQEVHFCPEEDVKALIKVGELPAEDYDLLLLTSLSYITDEDAVAICRILQRY